jgi:hypothetical protein
MGTWLVGASRIWLVASVVGFLSFQIVAGVGWISRTTVASLTSHTQNFNPARRDFFRYAAYLAGGLPFVAATYGFAAGRLRYKVEKVDVPIVGLPKALDGMRIAQLSDIHIGEFMPRNEVAKAVQIANELKPDLAVVT